ncbi:MAG: transporter substrate-binding domain-containing protein, partial [Methanospirillum sp.]|nr:transporter substrate-binding domain-containing protein [Methanospirillum sp.]
LPVLTVFGVILFVGILAPVTGEEVPGMGSLQYLTEEVAPFNYLDNGTPSGIAVDLLYAISGETGENITPDAIRFVPWTEGYNKVLTTPGYVLFSAERTPGREDLFSWAGPIYTYNWAFFASNGSNISINTTDDLKPYTFGVITNDSATEGLKNLGIPDDRIITRPDYRSLLGMLDDKTVDLIMYGDIAGEYLAGKVTGNSGEYPVVYRLKSVPLYYAFNKDTPESLVSGFNDALEKLKEKPADGGMSGYEEIVSRYVPAEEPVNTTTCVLDAAGVAGI